MNMQLTAIVAENKPLDREKLARYAHDLGIEVVSKVASGEWLIDECEKYEPDILFLNLSLNGIDGLSAYQILLDRGIKPYLILVTSNMNSELLLTGLKLNCLDILNKPIRYEQLMEAVSKARELVKRDLLISKSTPGRIIKIISLYKTIYINENNLIYAHKLKGGHKSLVFIEGEFKSGIETTTTLTDILKQCSKQIFLSNPSNLINLNYIKSVYVSEKSMGTYIIRLAYNDVEIELSRRKKRDFDQLFSTIY
ncbi:hypothetical protein BSK63_17350 [Paenibacillus odorifer]|uniref:LytR/AlgR family response regulator transcription factor n=1 Tax=Paenibacillus odorifer TaxID=189426 RepID=UPI00096D0079|nr:response regulator [Paenibacillus odorifer]OME30659.1 hypothetical protein BSK63_17350 [Paenibacillus odorifer]